jgi:hypothetical protein
MEKRDFCSYLLWQRTKDIRTNTKKSQLYTKREAVERIYAKMLNNKLFYLKMTINMAVLFAIVIGNVIANVGDETITYDGGYFVAVLKLIR